MPPAADPEEEGAQAAEMEQGVGGGGGGGGDKQDVDVENNINSTSVAIDPFANFTSPFSDRPHAWNSVIENSVYFYATDPLMHSVKFLLINFVLDRTGMWGTSYTNVPFLTGFYNGSFNPEMGSDQAAQFSSLAMVVAFITPFFTALLADGLFGDYSTILILMTCFSLPGLILMVLAAWPGLLSSVFGKLNQDVMRVGMLIFYPIGNGGMNTLNNIFSAKQYHPELQKDLIERYFVLAAIAIACAGLIAQLVITTIAAFNYVAALILLTVFEFLAIVSFVAGRNRYVRRKTDRLKVIRFMKALIMFMLPIRHKKEEEGGLTYKLAIPGPQNLREVNGGFLPDKFVDGFVRLLWIIPFQLLGLAANVCMFAFMNLSITQSFAMEHGKIWGGPQILFVMSIAAMIFGQLFTKKILPWMHSRGYSCTVGQKLSAAGFFYAFSYILYTIIDLQIHKVWNQKQQKISLWWQVFPLIPQGVAAILTVPTLDEFVFTLAPTEFKTLGNAVNKLVQVALSNQVVKSLYKVCTPWFENKTGPNFSNISNTQYYVEAEVWKFFVVMVGWGVLLFILGLLPPINKWVHYMESLSDPMKYRETEDTAADEKVDKNDGVVKVESSSNKFE